MPQAQTILGVWNNEEKDARIEVFKCGDKYCGKIVWVKEPNYPTGSTEGTPGTPGLDNHNPDPAQRSRPIFGLQIVKDFLCSPAIICGRAARYMTQSRQDL
jgi:hypothetical protein